MEYSIQNTNIWQSGLSDNDFHIFLMQLCLKSKILENKY